MKKNFFKKLSFVLALAMIVTALAPASGVFAAAKAPKLNSSSKYLYLDVEGKNEFDFNISNKKSGWKYLWSSVNEDVVDVNAKNGVVVATGAGKTTVSVVISDKDGEEVDELKATVTVRDNIKELTITNAPADGKLAVDEERDFNRSYVTEARNTKGSKAITRWTVTDKDGKEVTTATISDAGVFVANAAGEYTITANAFQSKAKYTSWLKDAAKYASYVTATTFTKVTVAPSMEKAEQVDYNTFKVTFDSPVTDVATKLAVSYMAGTAKIKEHVKSVTMDTTNTVATVDMYLDFTKGATYVVDYPGMTSVEFVAATNKVSDVTSMAVVTTTAQLSTKKTIEIVLYNKDNVNITNTDLLSRVTLEKTNNLVTLDGKDLYMYKVGDTTTVTATFHTYSYDTTGKEIGNLTATGVITCVEQAKSEVGTLNAYTVGTTAGAFKDVKHTVAKGDTPLKLFVQLKGKNAAGNDKNTDNVVGSSDFGNGTWTYTSSNTGIIITDATGAIYAIGEGTAIVVVKYNDVQVGAAEIIVSAKRKAAVVTLASNNISVSNTTNFADIKTVVLSVKDQLGEDYNQANYTVAVASNIVSVNATNLMGVMTKTSVEFDGYTVPAGTYYYTVTVTDTANSGAKTSTFIIVDVKAPGTTVAYYQIEADKSSYDMKITDTDLTENVTLSLYGYSSNGVKISKENINNTTLTIKDGSGAAVTAAPSTADTKNAVIELVTTTASGSMMMATTKAKGTWLVSATSGTPINAINFQVNNTQGTPTLAVSKISTTVADLTAAINDCFDFTLNGNSKDVANLGDVETTVATGKQAQVNNVYIIEQIGTSTTYIKHKVVVNQVINYAQPN